MSRDPVWLDWSVSQLKLARLQDGIAINPVIYAEIASSFESRTALNDYLRPLEILNAAFSDVAAFLAGQAFWAYRQRKGAKTGVLPDFFIGAQAQSESWTLLTRDATRYRTYFPGVKLISP
ncbi:MAG: DNA-binding protein [Polaromonas sp.]|nr:DNA-binding protein [Polaromonas sp.]